MNIDKLEKLDFDEFKFRLFKKFGKDAAGNGIFINSTINDIDNVVKDEEFLNSSIIYAYRCIYDQENIYPLTTLEEKKYFLCKELKESESINFFDKNLSWVITRFHQNLI